MSKMQMLLLIYQIDGLLKNSITRKRDYLEIKKILDTLRNKVFSENSGIF